MWGRSSAASSCTCSAAVAAALVAHLPATLPPGAGLVMGLVMGVAFISISLAPRLLLVMPRWGWYTGGAWRAGRAPVSGAQQDGVRSRCAQQVCTAGVHSRCAQQDGVHSRCAQQVCTAVPALSLLPGSRPMKHIVAAALPPFCSPAQSARHNAARHNAASRSLGRTSSRQGHIRAISYS
jgi:hypothetical protein